MCLAARRQIPGPAADTRRHYQPGNHQIRTIHSTSAIATNSTVSRASCSTLGLINHQRPRTAVTDNHSTAARVAPPIKAPVALALNAPTICPRMKCAQAVVMPHVGQRTPNSKRTVQGGNPNC